MGKQSREKWGRRSELAVENTGGSFFSKFGIEKACLLIVQWGTYVALFTPLVISTDFFFPFVTPKTIFFRVLVEIIFAAYLILLLANKKYRPRINVLTITITLFLAVYILSSLTGINLSRSFWSTYERMTGIFTMLHLFAFFIVLTGVFKKKEDWEKVLGVSIIVGIILSLYILMGKGISTRGGGTIGNTSFMAAYLLFDVFFAIILFLAKRGWWQIFAGAGLVVMLPVLLASTGRGAIFSFFLGLFLLGLGYLAFSRKKALKRLALSIVLVLIVFGSVLAVLQPPIVEDKIDDTLKEMNSRFVVWEKGWKGFLERPILGWGPENFIVVFNKNFNSCMFLSECGNEIWFDRVHNVVLDTLVTTGIIGFLSYISIFIVAIGGLLRLVPKIVEKRNIFIPLGLAVLLIAYFAQNLLVFDMINTYLVFFLALAFINFLLQKENAGSEEKPDGRKGVNPVFASAIIIITAFVFWAGNLQPIIANHNLIKTIAAQNTEDMTIFFEKALDTWMEKYEPREYFVQKVSQITQEPESESERAAMEALFNLTEAEMEKSVRENPLDFRPHLFLGELYLKSYRSSGNQEKLVKAEETLKKAIELSPTNQQGYWNLAEVRLATGNINETINLLQQALALEPRLGHSHWYLAMAYNLAGEYELAKEEIIAAEENGYNWKDSTATFNKVVEVYESLGDDAALLNIFLEATEANPGNAQHWAALAAAYANLGQFNKAAEAAERVVEIDPEMAPSVEQFLTDLP